MSTLRSFTSFWVQVFAIAVVLVGIALAVNIELPSWYTIAVIGWAAFVALLVTVALHRTKPLRYLFAFVYAVADWFGGFWERLSYFVTSIGLMSFGVYLGNLHANHYWSNPAWRVYLLGFVSVGGVIAAYGFSTQDFHRKPRVQPEDDSSSSWYNYCLLLGPLGEPMRFGPR